MIDVSCALIKGQNGEILVTQRSSKMRLPLKWEFPGGKVELGETEEDCLIREIAEELGILISIDRKMTARIHHQEEQSIRLIPFVCKIEKGEICLTEHAAYAWLAPAGLKQLDWAEADLPVVDDYLSSLVQN